MTDHDHTPPLAQYTARYLSPGKFVALVGNQMHVLTWDEAHKLAVSLTEALQLEVRQ